MTRNIYTCQKRMHFDNFSPLGSKGRQFSREPRLMAPLPRVSNRTPFVEFLN